MDENIWPSGREIANAIISDSNILEKRIRDNYECFYAVDDDGDPCDEPTCEEGSFGIAFLMKNKLSESCPICFRIWTKDANQIDSRANFSERQKLISRALHNSNLPYFLDFSYIPEAIKVGERRIPGITMKWVDGLSLVEYVKKHASNSILMNRLSEKFLQMCRDLRKNGISHGDLSCTNIMVTNDDEIRLIDYDSVHVPLMGNHFYQITGGVPGFQHPYRLANSSRLFTSSNDDNFSQQVIYLSLLAICKNTELVKYTDKELLFLQKDFNTKETFVNSNAYKWISSIDDEKIKMLLEELKKSVSGSYNEIRSIVEIIDNYKSLIVFAGYCGTCGHHFLNQTDLFCPDCGKKRETL